jgi:hypothetical protein
MSKHLQNLQLMQQLKTPLAKQLAPVAFDIGHDHARDVESIYARDINGNELRRDLSPEGKRGEAAKHRRLALRDLRDNVRKPIDKYHAKTEAMRASIKRAAYDKPDSLDRWKLRDRSLTMTFGQRTMRMTGPNRDKAFVDAVLEFAPWVSGFDEFEPNELKLYEEAKQERERELNGPLFDQIASRDSEEEEALMVWQKTRDDIALDSGLERKDFEAEAKLIETKAGAPWLKKFTEDGREIVRVVDFEALGGPVGRIATPDEIRDGQFFKDHSEYLASRAA